ncbi:hypothetical protein BH10PSE7_BH10PSE7_07280 [soil metagenome]
MAIIRSSVFSAAGFAAFGEDAKSIVILSSTEAKITVPSASLGSPDYVIDIKGHDLSLDTFGRLASGTITDINIPSSGIYDPAVEASGLNIDAHAYGIAILRSVLGEQVDFQPLVNEDYKILGTSAADFIGGGSLDDVIYSYAGNDALGSGAGNDSINSGAGDDTFSGGAGDDTLIGGIGRDTALFGPDSVRVDLRIIVAQDTGEGNDVLLGIENLDASLGDDFLAGSNVSNLLRGFEGDDTLSGRGGNDTLDGGNYGNNLLYGGSGNDMLHGGVGLDRLSGGTGNDWLDGGEGFDRLAGNTGNDTLSGGSSRDVLTGGTGNDVLSGGQDNDLFVFGAGNGADLIVTFENGLDQLSLHTLGFSSFADVAALATDNADGMRLVFGGGNSVQIDLFSKAQFDASDVIL